MSLNLEYRLPTAEDESVLKRYVKEHYDVGEQNISAGMGLTSNDYTDWLEEIIQNTSVPNGEWGRSKLLLCFFEGELVGLLSIRYELSEALRRKYGDIGYGIRPSQRRKGFANEMLRYGLTICREHGMKDVIIGCYKDNLASVKTILKNHGDLIGECDEYEKGRLSQYYRIDLYSL